MSQSSLCRRSRRDPADIRDGASSARQHPDFFITRTFIGCKESNVQRPRQKETWGDSNRGSTKTRTCAAFRWQTCFDLTCWQEGWLYGWWWWGWLGFGRVSLFHSFQGFCICSQVLVVCFHLGGSLYSQKGSDRVETGEGERQRQRTRRNG